MAIHWRVGRPIWKQAVGWRSIQKDAKDLGVRNGEIVRIDSPENFEIAVHAVITDSVEPGVVFMPYHWTGQIAGKDMRSSYPQGTEPAFAGEPANLLTTQGYDAITMTPESKTTLCRIRRLS